MRVSGQFRGGGGLSIDRAAGELPSVGRIETKENMEPGQKEWCDGEAPVAWINQRKNIVRVAVLVLLLVAIVGPWTYSSDGTPPAEWCRDPNILLENGRCVRLVSGAEVLTFMTGAFLSLNLQLVKGTLVLADRAREFFGVFLFVVLLFLLVQPFFSTLLLIFGGDRPRRGMYHVATWGLAAVISALLLVASCWSGLRTDLWGIWLYVGLAASVLAVELSAIRRISA